MRKSGSNTVGSREVGRGGIYFGSPPALTIQFMAGMAAILIRLFRGLHQKLQYGALPAAPNIGCTGRCCEHWIGPAISPSIEPTRPNT